MTSRAATTTTRVLDDVQHAFYRANGYLVVEQLVPDSLLEQVQTFLEGVVEAKIAEWRRAGLITESYAEHPFASRYFIAWEAAGRPESDNTGRDGRSITQPLLPLISCDRLHDPAAALVGARQVTTLESCFYRAKFPGDASTTLPWHQDAPCLDLISGMDFITAWIPLDDVSEHDSCLEVSPVGAEQELFEYVWSESLGYRFMHPEDADRLTERRAIGMQRGDVLFFSPFLPHRSRDNTGTETRWSVDFRYAPI